MKIIIKRFRNEISDIRAFTLAEALVAIIILLLVTTIVATGIPAALRAYDRVVIASNAEVLLSTSMSALRNELGTAKDVDVRDNKVIYYSEGRNSMSEISKQNNDKDHPNTEDIMIRKYAPDGIVITDTDVSSKMSDGLKEIYQDKELLISSEAADKDKGLHITYDSIEKHDGFVTFKNLKVLKKNGGTTKAVREKYSIRIISEE